MDNEKIKELAREYAEDIFGKDDYPFKEDDMCNAEADFESVVEFLSKTHCLVDKEKVNDFWHEITTVYLNGGKITYDGARFMFQSLFGSELFNTTEK